MVKVATMLPHASTTSATRASSTRPVSATLARVASVSAAALTGSASTAQSSSRASVPVKPALGGSAAARHTVVVSAKKRSPVRVGPAQGHVAHGLRHSPPAA